VADTPQVQVDYASGRTTPTVIVKAPSSESIKSWNVNQAETLRLKCNIEAIEAAALEEDTEEEDPFDTKQFEGIVAELKEKEEDPFDTSAVVNLGPSEIKSLEKDLLNSNSDKSNVDLLSDSKDPFDTGFVEELLPNKGDPFNTDHIPEDDFDPFDTTVADAVIPVRKPRVDPKTSVSIEDTDFDPEASYKTRKAPPPPRPPPQTEKETDPFFTEQEKKEPPQPAPVKQPVKPPVFNKYARKRPQTLQEKSALEEAEQARQRELELEIQGLTRSLTDEDFNPREATPPPPKTPTPESPDPFNTDGVDPFDTSAIGITG
jgi:hypothetical protein